MTSYDSAGSCSSYGSRNERDNIIYNNQHLVDVFYSNCPSTQKNIAFVLMNLTNGIKLKVRDVTNYAFNYTAFIDWSSFDRLRKEQSLDISFEEFQPQIIDLLNQISAKQMQVRLDADDAKCKVVFYEKSRLKSLIFLTIDLGLTNQKELVEEMSDNISQLKSFNKNLTTQLSLTKNQLFETELLLKTALNKNTLLEKQFYKDLEVILQTFLSRVRHTETNISVELSKLTKRHQKLQTNLDLVKTEQMLKNEARMRLMQTTQNLRIENERNHRSIVELKHEIDVLRIGKTNMEDSCKELRLNLSAKEGDINSFQKQMSELRRDLQDATMIITQKTKTNDELGKDLFKANQLLVNFNSQYDTLSNEVDQLKETLACKDDVIRTQVSDLQKLNQDFLNYRTLYNAEDVNSIRHELRHAKQRIDELEKQNRDATKLNGLLTKKLSNGEYEAHARNSNLAHPNKS